MLVFHKGYEQETVQVAFDKDESSKIDTTRLNAFCFQFKSPGKLLKKLFIHNIRSWTTYRTQFDYRHFLTFL